MLWWESPVVSPAYPVVRLIRLVLYLLVQVWYSWMYMVIETLWCWVRLMDVYVVVNEVVGAVLTLETITFVFTFVIFTFFIIVIVIIIEVMSVVSLQKGITTTLFSFTNKNHFSS